MILILAVGQRQPSWVLEASDMYLKRFPSSDRPSVQLIKSVIRKNGLTIDKMLETEANRIQSLIPKGAAVVTLDESGDDLDTLEFLKLLNGFRKKHPKIAFVIGGADGLHRQIKGLASRSIRLSSMTLPHGMARVLLIEQLYRAYSITIHHPYHRD
jgi:23S rRNA (pseudouridine1915-N3)-methyltransferase